MKDPVFDRIRALFGARREIARLEAVAEAAYSAMYEAPRYGVRDCFDDAFGALSRAIAIAKGRGMEGEVARLTARRDHIYNVYDRQFRGS